MEEKINIAAILKDKPNGLRLYSPIFGECSFSLVREETDDICVEKYNGENEFFDSKGLYYNTGEVMLFPSKEMRDWSKFSWKRGDVLANGEGDYCVFKEFAHSSYQTVKAVFVKRNKESIHSDSCLLDTKDWHKASHSCTATYINTIEKELSGKLNMETLEIEKAQHEFKDGDIVVYGKSVAICRRIYKHTLSFYISLNEMVGLLFADEVESSEEYRFATEEEKQQLFYALEKEGKAWDAEKKEVVALKPKWTPKPFDRVITRNDDDDIWTANIFSHMDSHGEYVTIGCVGGYTYCIPYNDETAKLIGTTNNVDG